MDDFINSDMLYLSDDGLDYGYDTTGDGQIDMFMHLTDPYGIESQTTCFDTTGNGIFDTFQGMVDMDGDGYAESFFLANDYDQDGDLDFVKIYSDFNYDGDYDTVTSIHADNENPEVAYRVETDVDITGDHTNDYHFEDFIQNEIDFPQYAFTSGCVGSSTAEGLFDPATPEEFVSGTPAEDMQVWQCQGQTNRCALFSQLFTIEQLTGEHIDVEDFVATAIEKGWFTEEGGTKFLNMDKMLDYYDIDHNMVFDSNMEHLEAELNNGSKLIVSVDSGQIWYGKDNDIFSPNTRADHALQVIGIDRSDPDNPMVVLNDSGTPSGCGEMVPFDVFEEAWAAGDHQLIVCRA